MVQAATIGITTYYRQTCRRPRDGTVDTGQLLHVRYITHILHQQLQ